MRAEADYLTELLRWLGDGVAFPGRVRLFADQRVAGALPPRLALQREWPQADGASALAAATGAAWVEQARGGRVLIVLDGIGLQSGVGWDAVALAARLGLPGLFVLVVGASATLARQFAAWDWNVTQGPWQRHEHKPTAHLLPEPWPTPGRPAPLPMAREWQPVRLAALQTGGLPPWPVDADEPATAALPAWLSWLAVRSPALLTADTPPWSGISPTAAALAALAQVASEGHRVCWRLPAGFPLLAHLATLADIGQRALPLQLVVDASDLPGAAALATLTGWWVIAPADTAETAAALAASLDQELPTLLALPADAAAPMEPWPAERAWTHGCGRWLARGERSTLVCGPAGREIALAAQRSATAAGLRLGVFHCSSLAPLPVHQLCEAAALAPLLVVPDDHGLVAQVRNAVASEAGARVLVMSPDAMTAAALGMLLEP